MTRAAHEIRAIGWGLAVLLAYTLLVLAHQNVETAEFLKLLGMYVSRFFGLWAVACIIAIMVGLLRAWRPDGKAPPPARVVIQLLRFHWQRDYMLGLVWPPALLVLLMASFNTFKQVIMPNAGFKYDVAFAKLDRLLFLGADAWQATHALMPSPWATYFLDKVYHAWFLPMVLGVIICSFVHGSFRLRTQYLFCYIFVWIGIGSIFSYVLSAAGPCFYNNFVGQSASFAKISETLSAQQAVVNASLPDAAFVALHYQDTLLRVFGQRELVIGGGISAMPSVHIGLSVLFACAAFQMGRLWGWLMAAYAVLIWLGSIHLGWHYAIDGILAAPLTIFAWRVSGRLADMMINSSVEATAVRPQAAS